jgi:alcohol dehydrogenase, propanol-preferring
VTSKAVRLQAPRGAIAVDTVEVREPGPGEALVRMEACGICHTELFVASLENVGLTPLTLGHEGIARVEAVGSDVHGWRVGDRAGMTFLATTCGVCEYCRTGAERYCPKQTNFGFSAHGALSEYAVVPARALVRVPEGIDAVALAPMCCAGWTAFGALREAALAPGQTVAIFGYGGLGHLAVQLARRQGLRVAVADVSEAKQEAARAAGADVVTRALLKEWGGVDAAIVFTGNPAAIPEAFKAVKRQGTTVLVGISANKYELPLIDTIVKGARLRGSYLGTREDLEAVFALAASGELRAHIETGAIDDAPATLDRLHRGEIDGRAVVQF